MEMIYKRLLIFLIGFPCVMWGQYSDTLSVQGVDTLKVVHTPDSLGGKGRKTSIKPLSFVIPLALIARGATSIDSRFDHKLQHYVTNGLKGRFPADDYLQYLPVAAVFALPNVGMPAKHTLKQRVVVGATAHILMGIFVNTTKYSVRQLRPDGSTRNSFPSGHTSFVFTGVEMLYQEYKDTDLWVGITGYTVATAVGLSRIYNNRHWASDVVAGAGVGILSTKIAYLLLPYIYKEKPRKSPQESPTLGSFWAVPTYDPWQNSLGVSVNFSF